MNSADARSPARAVDRAPPYAVPDDEEGTAVLESLGWGEIAVLVVLALFVFGPERLPGMAGEAGRALRRLRLYVKSVTADLSGELGPELGEVDLASLNPRTFVQKHLLSDDEDEPVRASPRSGAPLRAGEAAPWDPDAT